VSGTPTLVLASQSPRRLQLLRQIGVEAQVWPARVDEARRPGEDPYALVERLARSKALAVAAKAGEQVPVLGTDTVVVLDGHIIGKPANAHQAVSALLRLSGREHFVATAVALASRGRVTTLMSRTKVRFRSLDRDEAVAYWDTGEARDKAGGYGIQGLAAVFVECIEGSFSGVVGLPLLETFQLLRGAGVNVLRS